MKDYRAQRIAGLFKREIATIVFSDAADPRLKRLTITHVEVTPDIKHARVYVSFPGEPKESEESFRALQKASSYIRSSLSQHIQIRYMPEIEFIYDHSLEKACHVIELLNTIEKKSGC